VVVEVVVAQMLRVLELEERVEVEMVVQAVERLELLELPIQAAVEVRLQAAPFTTDKQAAPVS
jgi:hypothetical protein